MSYQTATDKTGFIIQKILYPVGTVNKEMKLNLELASNQMKEFETDEKSKYHAIAMIRTGQGFSSTHYNNMKEKLEI
ncbi:hypothetical protein KUL152_34730 [Tenacibaculum sp. KUL152]|nr:hypothetical protein KUL152_34730 [Tenacibaculum sp. KUL152]